MCAPAVFSGLLTPWGITDWKKGRLWKTGLAKPRFTLALSTTSLLSSMWPTARLLWSSWEFKRISHDTSHCRWICRDVSHYQLTTRHHHLEGYLPPYHHWCGLYTPLYTKLGLPHLSYTHIYCNKQSFLYDVLLYSNLFELYKNLYVGCFKVPFICLLGRVKPLLAATFQGCNFQRKNIDR